MMKKPSVRALVIASGISFPSLLALALPGAAHADLTVCNNSGEMVRVAVGYSAADGPVSGGWWTFDPNECGRLVSDDQVVDRTTYWVYAEQLDGGGTWEGTCACAPRGKKARSLSTLRDVPTVGSSSTTSPRSQLPTGT